MSNIQEIQVNLICFVHRSRFQDSVKQPKSSKRAVTHLCCAATLPQNFESTATRLISGKLDFFIIIVL